MNIPMWVQISAVAWAYLLMGVYQVAMMSYFKGKNGYSYIGGFDAIMMAMAWPILDVALASFFIVETFENVMRKIHSLGEQASAKEQDKQRNHGKVHGLSDSSL